jgi:hypothetical protein
MVIVLRNTKWSLIGAASVLGRQIIEMIKAFRASVTIERSGNLAVIIIGTVRESGVATVVIILPSLVGNAGSKIVAVITDSVAIIIFLIWIRNQGAVVDGIRISVTVSITWIADFETNFYALAGFARYQGGGFCRPACFVTTRIEADTIVQATQTSKGETDFGTLPK